MPNLPISRAYSRYCSMRSPSASSSSIPRQIASSFTIRVLERCWAMHSKYRARQFLRLRIDRFRAMKSPNSKPRPKRYKRHPIPKIPASDSKTICIRNAAPCAISNRCNRVTTPSKHLRMNGRRTRITVTSTLPSSNSPSNNTNSSATILPI